MLPPLKGTSTPSMAAGRRETQRCCIAATATPTRSRSPSAGCATCRTARSPSEFTLALSRKKKKEKEKELPVVAAEAKATLERSRNKVLRWKEKGKIANVEEGTALARISIFMSSLRLFSILKICIITRQWGNVFPNCLQSWWSSPVEPLSNRMWFGPSTGTVNKRLSVRVEGNFAG